MLNRHYCRKLRLPINASTETPKRPVTLQADVEGLLHDVGWPRGAVMRELFATSVLASCGKQRSSAVCAFTNIAA